MEADPDAILNHEGEGILDDNICKSYDSVKQMQVQILLAEQAVHKTGSVVTSREVLLEDLTEIELVPEHPWKGYYTYAKGKCLAFHSDLSDAIQEADGQMGVVVDSALKPVWKRAKRLVCTPIQMPEDFHADDMQAFYPDAVEYDLTGCKLTQTLYYVSQGIPVEVTPEEGKTELIVGYDSANIWIYYPQSGTTTRKPIADAEEMYGTHSSRYRAFLQ